VTNSTKIPNRLVNEKSPYLLQHAYNPVNWWPWCDEAFAKAKAEDKPIFLSIGYSACHWCHVMEEESFEDKETAAILNQKYIAVKVDREERPDIDNFYMMVCQMMTGHGGWPLSVFLDYNRKPFYSGTYFPKESRYGMPGFKDLLWNISELWQNDKANITAMAARIIEAVGEQSKGESAGTEGLAEDAYMDLLKSYDKKYGGFGRAPKFPSPHNLLFLLRYWYVQKEDMALEMVENTLLNMSMGGIYDHVGYGFCRYSTDDKWLVPHFEKMLYDNAWIAFTMAEAYQATSKGEEKNLFKDRCDEIFKYVVREMQDKKGGFYSSQDADSEGEEGLFYIWNYDEIKSILGADFAKFVEYFNISGQGNFEGKNILSLKKILIPKSVKFCLKKLSTVREQREKPFKDDKILTAWNGYMIAAFAYAARVFDNKEYYEHAVRGIEFIKENLMDSDSKLYIRYKEGQKAYEGLCDDYASVIFALIYVYGFSDEISYIEDAVKLCDLMIELFWDVGRGGFYQTPEKSDVIVRLKPIYDSAVPSCNSLAAFVLVKLYYITGKDSIKGTYEYGKYAEKLFSVFSADVQHYPAGYTFYLAALLEWENGGQDAEITYINEIELKNILNGLYKKYRPFLTTSAAPGDKNSINICTKFSCLPPVGDISKLDEMF
jgi:uncharacterized protein YyaL (SSP411 family)